jgi:ubiquitin C-terminal hydrolase
MTNAAEEGKPCRHSSIASSKLSERPRISTFCISCCRKNNFSPSESMKTAPLYACLICWDTFCGDHFKSAHLKNTNNHFAGVEVSLQEQIWCFKCKKGYTGNLDQETKNLIKSKFEKEIPQIEPETIKDNCKPKDSPKGEKDLGSKPEKIFGLRNLGNTCYLNSSLQLLCSIGYSSQITSSLFPSQKRNRVVFSPKQLLHDFVSKLSDEDPLGEAGEQQDSHEFLLRFIDFASIIDRDEHFTKALGFTIEWTSSCLECGNRQVTKQSSPDISLSLARGLHCDQKDSTYNLDDLMQNLHINGGTLTVQNLLGHWLSPCHVNDGNCDKCKRIGNLTLQSRIISTNQFILFHLQRYSNHRFKSHEPKNNQRTKKMSKKVAAPSFTKDDQNVELTKLLKINEDEFELVACILHHGQSLNSGHYTAVCKRGDFDPTWVHFNDDIAEILENGPPRNSANAYILAYSKK